jgi:L-ribulose-5-phosphate 3-epimerase
VCRAAFAQPLLQEIRTMNRRQFVQWAAISAAATSSASAAQRLPMKKGLVYGMLPKELSHLEKFRLARDCGFEEVELYTTPEQKEAEEFKSAAEKTGLRIHSVMNQAHWKYPLSSADPEVVKMSMDGMRTSLRNAHFWGAETVLLVPAVVNPETSYRDAWVRSQKQIRELLPMARDLKVVIGVEEVWNKFLLSPLEFATYVDEFKSPWVKAYFDVGNMVLYGYPQDWIRTLGKRIVKVHFKDFRFRKMQAEFVNLMDGDINWQEVHKAFTEIGYRGSVTVELNGGDAAYLKDVATRVDKILNGA